MTPGSRLRQSAISNRSNVAGNCDLLYKTKYLAYIRSMVALSRIFFRPPTAIPESAGAVIDWWESRRPIYNVAVGATGVVTLGVMNVVLALPPSPQPLPAALNIIGPLAYGVAANFFYSGG